MAVRAAAKTNAEMMGVIRAFGRELVDHAESYAAGIMDGQVGTGKLEVTATFILDGESIPMITVRRECLSMGLIDAFTYLINGEESDSTQEES